MILTTSALTHFLQNRRFTWDLSQKKSFSSHLATANPNGTARFNTSKTPLWNCKSQWNSAIQHLQNNTLKLQIPMELRRKRVTFTKPCACAAKCITFFYLASHFDVLYNGIAAQSDTFSSHKKSPARASPNDRANRRHRERLRTVADGCERLRTVAVAQANFGEHTSNPQTPNL